MQKHRAETCNAPRPHARADIADGANGKKPDTLGKHLSMEKLLQYIWKHKIFPLQQLRTTTGEAVEVVDPGLQNNNDGPDFFNAKIIVDGMLWAGNVEIHVKSSDWYVHRHDKDSRYNNVVMHVAAVTDTEVVAEDGHTLRQMQMEVPEHMQRNYQRLLSDDRYPPCRKAVESLPKFTIHSWLSALCIERLQHKALAIEQRVRECDGSWETAFFNTMARCFGFGINSEGFELLAQSLPLMQVGRHRDDPFQVEALFMGQAGLLDTDAMNDKQRTLALADDYFVRMRDEYRFLAHKYALRHIGRSSWKFMRVRPQNLPYMRLAQLAQLYCSRKAELASLTQCNSLGELRKRLDVGVSDYWRQHYVFGQPTASRSDKHISKASVDILVSNAVVPTLHAYGRHRSDARMMQKAIDMLEEMKAEDNNIVRMWAECGVEAKSAADSQAVMQLHRNYCERKDCLRCRFGYYSLKRVDD